MAFLQHRQAYDQAAFVYRQFRTSPRDRFGDVTWRAPTEAGVCSILKNPAYTGAFVYGRTRSTGKRGEGGLRKPLPPDQWRVCIRDKYPPYISWETYNRIQAMLRDNYAQYDRNQSRGIPRPGKALLHGLVFCGECGHKMVVQYKRGTRYVCNHLQQQFQQPVCQILSADPIDQRVVGLFMEAFSAVELDLHARVVAQARQQHRQRVDAARQQLERLRYQVRLAERQFNQADPDNRLVTAELEKRWEQALQALKQAEERLPPQPQQSLDPPVLDAATRKALENVGRNLPAWWPDLSAPRKKALLRCLIEKVVLRRLRRDTVQVRVVWKGGEVTSREVPLPVSSLAALSQAQQMQERVLKLSGEGHRDPEVARRLTQAGFRSPMGRIVLPSTVKEIRLRHGLLLRPGQSHPRRVHGYLTVAQLARKLGILGHWIYDRIHSGIVEVSRDPATGLYLFPNRPKTLEQFRQLFAGKLHHLRI